MPLRFRTASPVHDRGFLLEAEVRAQRDSGAPIPPTHEQEHRLDQLFTLVAREHYWIFLAIDIDERVGAVFVDRLGGRRGTSIDNLYVRSHARRRGIGTQLVHLALMKTDEVRLPSTDVSVRINNIAAVAFFRSIGFTVIERLELSGSYDAVANVQLPSSGFEYEAPARAHYLMRYELPERRDT